ncbi:lysosomal thioesterase PPT2 homolog [Bradysia coprophila]|uniref:lysosomal thioesterase PPT2 homolog n=1 Tax=Bradysia coprophila TaxID=38358 RepID=UPI00187DD4D0|nr:lysosomal thioesterase PPT2 homolog [Bradysia coprophila]
MSSYWPILLVVFLKICSAYKPVVLIHGILTGPASMLIIEGEVKKMHPDTIVYNFGQYAGWSSLENAWHQVDELGTELMSLCKVHPDGIHLLGYSQGGLLSRAIIESFPDHCVKNFISLSSPQAGQYGTAFLHLIFPNLVAQTAYQLFYSYVGQHTSVGNYWNDPHQHDLYLQYSSFLPYINNELNSVNSTKFRDGMLKLNLAVFIGGPSDGVITPWESSHFGFYDEDDNVVPMHKRSIYRKDSIGLKTLEDQGKLKMLTFQDVRHKEWHLNVDIINDAIIPYLD